MGLGSEIRSQMVLFDEKCRERDVMHNIERDEHLQASTRQRLGSDIIRVLSGERVSRRVDESAERTDRRRAHEAESAAHAIDFRDDRSMISGFYDDVTSESSGLEF